MCHLGLRFGILLGRLAGGCVLCMSAWSTCPRMLQVGGIVLTRKGAGRS